MNPVFYIETSVALSCLFGEPKSKDILNALQKAKTFVSSTLTLLEAERAVVRAESQQILKEVQAGKVRTALYRMISSWILLEIDSSIRERAGQLFPKEPVRALDAIHLSTMLKFTQPYPDLQVASLDERILLNLDPLGLSRVDF